MSTQQRARKSERERDRPLALSNSGATVRDRITPPPPKRKAPSRRAAQHAVPTFERHSTSDMYRGMVAEVAQTEEGPRSLKRRRTAVNAKAEAIRSTSPASVVSVEPMGKLPAQTTFDDSDHSGGSDVDWEDIDLQKDDEGNKAPQPADSGANVGGISVVIGGEQAKTTGTSQSKRLPSTAVEKKKRLDVHKMHVCCLLAHVYTRNAWCNDESVQARLRPLLGARVESYLNPDEKMSQFQRSRSFMDGLQQASDLWKASFRITTRGLRRPLWALSADQLLTHSRSEETESPITYLNFLAQASNHKGSRDLGAQLFCALLRSAGVEARLVCSLQPLPFAAVHSAPTSKPAKPTAYYAGIDSDAVLDTADEGTASDTSVKSSRSVFTPVSACPKPIRRFGQAAAAFAGHDLGKAPPVQAVAKQKRIRESAFPVFWVEAYNSAYQKWIPVDPLVTGTIAKTNKFEPPAADASNYMSYVVAFADDNTARDVTVRYTKAYNAKTRRARVETTKGGSQWWRKAMRVYKREQKEDQDQLEDAELAKSLNSEPMPQNVNDFKDHPYYALERHLKQNEVINPKREVGKVSTGKGAENVEVIYRRQDVHVVRTADKWYRLGREIKTDEHPLKFATKKRRTRARSTSIDDADAHTDDEAQGTALYAGFQTQLYMPPPVVRGRIPKNAFGNLDLYVPSMIPAGGMHIRVAEAAKAARLLGVDYADAVTGFQFKGRHGTAVMNGVVVANEYGAAVEEAVRSMRYERERAVAAKQTREALRLWKRFLTGLRIRERIMGYGDDERDIRERIDRAEDEDERLRAEGGFVPGDYEADADTAARLKRPEPVEETPDVADLGEIPASIPSPWDLPRTSRHHPQPDLGVANVAPRTSSPQPEPGGFVVDDEEGGFVRAEDEAEGGFLREEGAGGGGFTTDNPLASVAKKAKLQTAQNTKPHTNLPPTPPTPPARRGLSSAAAAANDDDNNNEPFAPSPAQLTAPPRTQQLKHNASVSSSSSSPAGSLFSHDPDDDEAEPDWLVEDVGL